MARFGLRVKRLEKCVGNKNAEGIQSIVIIGSPAEVDVEKERLQREGKLHGLCVFVRIIRAAENRLAINRTSGMCSNRPFRVTFRASGVLKGYHKQSQVKCMYPDRFELQGVVYLFDMLQ